MLITLRAVRVNTGNEGREIPRVRVGYNHLISKKHDCDNCFIKTAHKITKFFPALFVKTTDFQYISNFEQTRTVRRVLRLFFFLGGGE